MGWTDMLQEARGFLTWIEYWDILTAMLTKDRAPAVEAYATGTEQINETEKAPVTCPKFPTVLTVLFD